MRRQNFIEAAIIYSDGDSWQTKSWRQKLCTTEGLGITAEHVHQLRLRRFHLRATSKSSEHFGPTHHILRWRRASREDGLNAVAELLSA